MQTRTSLPVPTRPDASGVVTWVHVGDLHMTPAATGDAGRNAEDLRTIVADVNRDFGDSLAFVFLPGDNADDGGVASYEVVRRALDELAAPWFAIVGDHDVHERSDENFRRFLGPETRYAFSVGGVRFVAMNAFAEPSPDALVVSDDQADWLEGELSRADGPKVVLLHCYPSELKTNAARVGELIRRYDVRVVDMGHTHYNEVANDGRVVYTATRSTGQIEEGPVGYSVSNLDGDAFSWRFFPAGASLLAMIVSPCDERLRRDGETASFPDGTARVRARVWGAAPVVRVEATVGGETFSLIRIEGSNVWEGTVTAPEPSENGGEGRTFEISVRAEDESGEVATDTVQLTVGAPMSKVFRCDRDVDNAVEAWEERGLLGTRLGPNANGRKW